MKYLLKYDMAPAGPFVQVHINKRIFADDALYDLLEQTDGITYVCRPFIHDGKKDKGAFYIHCMLGGAFTRDDTSIAIIRTLQSTTDSEVEPLNED